MRARELIREGFLMGRMKGEKEGVGLLQASQRGPGMWKSGEQEQGTGGKWDLLMGPCGQNVT